MGICCPLKAYIKINYHFHSTCRSFTVTAFVAESLMYRPRHKGSYACSATIKVLRELQVLSTQRYSHHQLFQNLKQQHWSTSYSYSQNERCYNDFHRNAGNCIFYERKRTISTGQWCKWVQTILSKVYYLYSGTSKIDVDTTTCIGCNEHMILPFS